MKEKLKLMASPQYCPIAIVGNCKNKTSQASQLTKTDNILSSHAFSTFAVTSLILIMQCLFFLYSIRTL